MELVTIIENLHLICVKCEYKQHTWATFSQTLYAMSVVYVTFLGIGQHLVRKTDLFELQENHPESTGNRWWVIYTSNLNMQTIHSTNCLLPLQWLFSNKQIQLKVKISKLLITSTTDKCGSMHTAPIHCFNSDKKRRKHGILLYSGRVLTAFHRPSLSHGYTLSLQCMAPVCYCYLPSCRPLCY